MPSWLLDSFNAGFADFENKGVYGSFKVGSKALDIRKSIDSLTCQQNLIEEIVTDMNELALFHVIASDLNSYFFTRNGKIFRRSFSGEYLLVHTEASEGGNIIGAAEWYDNAGWTYLVWATPTRLNIKKLIGPSYTQTEPWNDVNVASTGTWPKTNLTSADWHTMGAVNGTFHICNSNVMALVGYDLSYTNDSLQLVPGNLAVTLLERGTDIIIGCKRKDRQHISSVFAWDQIADNYLSKKLIPKEKLNALIDTDKPLAQVGTNGAIYFADFLNVLPITFFPGGGQVYPDGVESDDGLALFGVFGNGYDNSGIYSYGKKKNNAPYALNFEYPLVCDEIGSIKKVDDTLFITYRLGTQYGVKKVNIARKAQAVYTGLDLSIPKKYIGDKLPTFTHMRIETAPMPVGTTIECKRKIDKKGDFTAANLEGGATAFDTVDGQEAIFYLGDKGKIINPQVILNPSENVSPEVYSIEVFFEIR